MKYLGVDFHHRDNKDLIYSIDSVFHKGLYDNKDRYRVSWEAKRGYKGGFHDYLQDTVDKYFANEEWIMIIDSQSFYCAECDSPSGEDYLCLGCRGQ